MPEEDEEYYESHLEENVRQQDHIQTSIQTLQREREERRERLKRDHVDDRPMRITRPYELEDGPQIKKAKHNDRNRLPPGWVGCPNLGHDIGFIVPSKVPLGESFNDLIPPGRRYSFRQCCGGLIEEVPMPMLHIESSWLLYMAQSRF